MAKSTNKGTCQWCGAIQKLPNELLSQHGYTTQWGFFEGVCRGSRNQPLEKSCELVKYSMLNQSRVKALQSTAKEIRGYIKHQQHLVDNWTEKPLLDL